MPIETARSIAKLGFRRWYERQLIESHAWLVTCLLCGIAIAASVEVLSFKNAADALLILAFMFVAGLICAQAVKRYLTLMEQAERIASRATCPACDKYARFQVEDQSQSARVRCRHCGHAWRLD
jgi:hypothetical protein